MENQGDSINSQQSKKFRYLFLASFVISSALIAGAIIYSAGLKYANNGQKGLDKNQVASAFDLQERILPSAGVELPVKWGNLGKQLVDARVIDAGKLIEIYANRGGIKREDSQLLDNSENEKIIITPNNAGYILNLFWAFGLANKNPVLEKGPMADSRYGGAGNFASTGGWTISKGDAMNHYSAHPFVSLNPEQQALVERVSKNIYRPCCGNSTYFPDCNHGMAMLGLLELMAANAVSENDMYKFALVVNSYWFPENYATIAKYFESKGIKWENVSAKDILGGNFSSSEGYQQILTQVKEPSKSGGALCGIGDEPNASDKTSGGCGV